MNKWFLHRSILIACLLVLLEGIFASGGQPGTGISTAEVAPGVTGYWVAGTSRLTSSRGSWAAQWIWLEEELEAKTMLARRSFTLDAIPEEARLRITATTQYELYVNSRYVSRGPARCAPHHQSFDEFEVGELLQQGQNLLAVRVHFQEGTVSYHHTGRPGLLVQLDFPSNPGFNSVKTGADWKVHPDTSWNNNSPVMSRFHLEVCDRVDLRRKLRGWQSIRFDDTLWSAAKPLVRNVGWPSPQVNANPGPLTVPWTSLVQRDIPYLLESRIKAVELLEAFPSEAAEIDTFFLTDRLDERIEKRFQQYKDDREPLLIPVSDSSSRWFLLFDFGTVLNGRPALDIEGPEGCVVRVHSAPFLMKNQFSAHIVDSRFIDQVTLSGQRDRWEATYSKPARYLGIEIAPRQKPVRIHFAGIHHEEYPFQNRGLIRTPGNEWIEQFWQASAKTIRVCTADAYTDNYRERRQYAQTAYYAALGNYWTFGDSALQRRYLRQIAQEQEANGIMPAYAPRHGNDYMVILDSNCLWIRGLRNYLLFSGDEETARELLPAARKLMHLLLQFRDSHGLIEDPPFPYWIDHARLDRRGASFVLNCFFLGALEDFSKTLEWLGQPDASEFQAKADRLRRVLKERFWNPDLRLFSDAIVVGEQSSMFSEHANAMSLALKVADPEQAEAVAKHLLAEDQHNYIQRESGITMVTPAMSYFLHEGLCKYGYVKESLQMLRTRFSRMLEPDTNQTLWEEWWLDGTGRSGIFVGGRTRSDAQTESAFPPDLFARFLLGIHPSKPGLKEIVLSRPESGLEDVQASIPSPLGQLSVHWKSTDRGIWLEISIPVGMQVKVDLKSLGYEAGSDLSFDGQEPKVSTTQGDFLILDTGQHRVLF